MLSEAVTIRLSPKTAEKAVKEASVSDETTGEYLSSMLYFHLCQPSCSQLRRGLEFT